MYKTAAIAFLAPILDDLAINWFTNLINKENCDKTAKQYLF